MQFIVQGYPAFAYTGGRPYTPKQPAIVFIHGAAFDHSVWHWQSRYLAHHGFTVLAPDLPAHGKSRGAARETIGAMADWIAALIESAGLDEVALVGHSMGSLVALETTMRHSARVKRLALVGTSAPMPVGEPFLAAARDDHPAAFDMEVTWGLSRGALLAASPTPGTSLAGSSRALNGRSRAGVLATDLAACATWQPSADAIRTIKVPTLVVAGKRDVMTPFKASRALADRNAGARFVAFDTGHSIMLEAPRPLLRELTAFLA